jgi:hypothetical protein
MVADEVEPVSKGDVLSGVSRCEGCGGQNGERGQSEFVNNCRHQANSTIF